MSLMFTLRSSRLAKLHELVMLSGEGQFMELVYLCVVPAAVLATVFAIVLRLLRPVIDTRELPLVSPRIPIFGHALGLLRYGVPYYAMAT